MQIFQERNPQLIGNDYTVIGTMKRPAWKQGVQKPIEFQDMPAYLNDFNQVLKFDLAGYLLEQEQDPVHVTLEHKGNPINRGTLPSNLLVDNFPKAMALVEKLKLALPITARPTKDLVNMLKKQGIQIERYRDVQIKDVHYMGADTFSLPYESQDLSANNGIWGFPLLADN